MKKSVTIGILPILSLFVLFSAFPAQALDERVYVSYPVAGSTLTGSVDFAAAAPESARIVAVQFLVDGSAVGAETAKIPFSYKYDFSGLSNGPHTVGAKGRDLDGNFFNAVPVSVTVQNPEPFTINSFSAAVDPTSAVLTWTTSRPATWRVDYGPNYGYGSAVTSASLAFSHRVTVARLGAVTKYYARVQAWDKDFNLVSRSDLDFTTAAAKGAQSIPSGVLYSSQTGNAVSGIVSLSVAPGFTDNDGVQFQVDSRDIGAKITGQGLQTTLDAGTLTNGPHTFSAIIWDKLGNTGFTNTISISVSNAATPSGTTWIDSRTARLVNSGGTFFLLSGSRRYGITDPGVLGSYGFEFRDASAATTDEAALPEGSVLAPGDGSLVKKAGDPTVWFSTGGKKYGFTSADVFLGLGFAWSNVREIAGSVLDALGVGSPLASATARHLAGVFVKDGQTIYRMEDLFRRGIPSMEVYNSWNIDNDFSALVPINAADIAVPVGTNLETRLFR